MLALLLIGLAVAVASSSSSSSPSSSSQGARLGFTPLHKGQGPPSIGVYPVPAVADPSLPLGYRAATQEEVATAFDMSVAALVALNPKATMQSVWRVGIPVRVYVWPDADEWKPPPPSVPGPGTPSLPWWVY